MEVQVPNLNVETNTLAWLAGYLEGEGCFTWRQPPKTNIGGSPKIEVTASDLDVLQRVAAIWGSNVIACNMEVRMRSTFGSKKQLYTTRCSGKVAIECMRAMRPYMGTRRGKKIDTILKMWDSLPRYVAGNNKGQIDWVSVRLNKLANEGQPA